MEAQNSGEWRGGSRRETAGAAHGRGDAKQRGFGRQRFAAEAVVEALRRKADQQRKTGPAVSRTEPSR